MSKKLGERRGCVLLLFVVLIAPTMCAQHPFWRPTNIPYGGTTSALAADSLGNVYAGTERGIFRTSDGGDQWTLCTREVVPLREALIVDATGVVMAGTYEGFWRSTDQGVTWQKTGLEDYPVLTLVSSPDSILYAGLRRVTGNPSKGPGGVFRSADGGLSWIPYGLEGLSITDMLWSSEHNLVALGLWNGVYQRGANDTGWTTLSSLSLDMHTIVEDPLGNFYIGLEMDGVQKSTDGGVSWSPTSLQLPYTVVTLGGFPTGEIFAGVMPLDPSIPGGMYGTSDGGESWETLGLTDWGIFCALCLQPNTLYVGSTRGVFRSTDGAVTWSQVNEGITATEIRSIACTDSVTVFAGTSSGLFRSTDAGQSWSESGSGIFPQSVTVLAVDHKRNLFAGNMVFQPNGGIYKSTDGGLSWRCVSADSIKGMYVGINDLVVTQANTILAAVDGNGTIYRSSDDGEQWTLVRKIPGSRQVRSFAADTAGQVYGATWGDGVLRSTDDGQDWEYTNPGLPNLNVSCLATRASDEVFAGGFWGVARSTNGGDSWKDLSAGLEGASVVALAVDWQGDLLASTNLGGVYRSTDDGETWVADTIGLSGFVIQGFATSHNSVFAVDTVRIYRSVMSATAVEPFAVEIPGEVKLDQNYPNPFNPGTSITYRLSVSGHVKLAVYDALGREVRLLVNERKEAGVHDVLFDASGLPSGAYFCRLKVGDIVATKKLLLLK